MFNGAFLGGVRIRGLGQAQIRSGTGFAAPAWSAESGLPAPSNAPPGFPSMSPEIATPGGEATEKHCYLCSDGQVRTMTINQARAMGGCQALPPSDSRCTGGGPVAPPGGYVSPLPGAQSAYGPNPQMFTQGLAGRRRDALRGRPYLGQVQLYQGPSGTPFYGYQGAGYFANPSGSPLMTEELTSPQSEHIAREFHCYKSPDGKYVSIPFGMADTYKAQGYEAVDYSLCATPPHAQPVGTGTSIAGRERRRQNLGAAGPSSPGTTSAPAGTSTGQAIAQAGQPTLTQESPFTGWPGYYPGYAPPTPQGMTCKKVTNPDTGEETFDCVPKAGPSPGLSYRYPVYFMNPFFF